MSLSPSEVINKQLAQLFKELNELGGILLNHTHVGLLRVVGKALHIISSGTPWRCIVVLKVAMWSKGSRIPSYESKEGILNFGGKRWPLMSAVKGSQSYKLSPLLDLPFLYFLSSHPWPFSSDPSPSPDVGPFERWYPLTGSQVQHFFCLLDSGYALRYPFRDVVYLN